MSDNPTQIYNERNTLAIALARAMIALGYKAGHAVDATKFDWDDDWALVVYIDLPDGAQLSYHMNPDTAEAARALPLYEGKWNGKYTGREVPEWLIHMRDLASPATAMHYPQHWDTQAYPTLESALSEVLHDFQCSECTPAESTHIAVPVDVIEAANKVGRWAAMNNLGYEWMIGPVCSREHPHIAAPVDAQVISDLIAVAHAAQAIVLMEQDGSLLTAPTLEKLADALTVLDLLPEREGNVSTGPVKAAYALGHILALLPNVAHTAVDEAMQETTPFCRDTGMLTLRKPMFSTNGTARTSPVVSKEELLSNMKKAMGMLHICVDRPLGLNAIEWRMIQNMRKVGLADPLKFQFNIQGQPVDSVSPPPASDETCKFCGLKTDSPCDVPPTGPCEQVAADLCKQMKGGAV